MGCCYSYEEEDDVPVPYTQPVRVVRPAPIPSRSSCVSYPHRNQFKTVAPVAPPTFGSVRVPERVPQPTVRAVVVKPTQEFKPRPGALYGEFKCSCRYFWVSRLSWRDRYQQCKRCGAQVRPRNQRELRPSDFSRGENVEGLEHPQHLCEMCKRVGGYCGKYKTTAK